MLLNFMMILAPKHDSLDKVQIAKNVLCIQHLGGGYGLEKKLWVVAVGLSTQVPLVQGRSQQSTPLIEFLVSVLDQDTTGIGSWMSQRDLLRYQKTTSS